MYIRIYVYTYIRILYTYIRIYVYTYPYLIFISTLMYVSIRDYGGDDDDDDDIRHQRLVGSGDAESQPCCLKRLKRTMVFGRSRMSWL